MTTIDHSVLGPVRTNSTTAESETERAAPWVVRKLVGSMTGRIVLSSIESLRAAGTNIVCLSPWGDSSPLILPCIRFRDLAIHTVIAATGGVAAVASPVMGPAADALIDEMGSSILVEIGVHAGFEATSKAADDLIGDGIAKRLVPIHSQRLTSTGVKEMIITLKFKHTMDDAQLGFYRSSFHADSDLFANVKDYLATEKGWFNPYLFASSRRPVIPRTMKPDVVFCHGPFLSGDYHIGQTILNEAAFQIVLAPAPKEFYQPPHPTERHAFASLHLPTLTNHFNHSRTSSPEPALVPHDPPASPRRMVITVVGLKPHRMLWSTSARPGESVITYLLLSGCPALVVPVKVGAPLVAWDTLTLEKLWAMRLPGGDLEFDRVREGLKQGVKGFEGVVGVLYEYLDLCIEWERVEIPGEPSAEEEEKRKLVAGSLGLIVAAAIRSHVSNKVKKDIDPARAGIAMWRIP